MGGKKGGPKPQSRKAIPRGVKRGADGKLQSKGTSKKGK